jgi:hypothetical protein
MSHIQIGKFNIFDYILWCVQNYNFACSFVWVWNLVSDIKGRIQTEDIWKQGSDENMWTEEEWNGRRLENIA